MFSSLCVYSSCIFFPASHPNNSRMWHFVIWWLERHIKQSFEVNILDVNFQEVPNIVVHKYGSPK